MSGPDLQQAVRLFKTGQLEAAANCCAALLEQWPDHAKSLLLMAAISQRQGDWQSARDCLQKAASSFGSDTDGVLQAVIALQRIGAADDAGHILEGLDSRFPAVSRLKAQNAWRLGDYSGALQQFRSVLQQWPELPANYVACVRAELRLGQADAARQTLEQGIAKFPRDDQLLRLNIACMLDLGIAGQALDLATRLASTDVESNLLQSALRSALAGDPFDASRAALNSRQEAQISSHHWVQANHSDLAWFGTGTGVLKWASAHLPAEGVVVECGVYHGLSINLLAEWGGRETHGFDSFEGLPEDWKADEPAGSYSTDGKLPRTHERVSLHPGWFEHSLPSFASGLEGPISLLHVDCDLYSSTRTVLETLASKLISGSILVFDDFLAYPGYEQHEFRAAREFFAGSSQQFELKAAVLLGRSVAYQLK